jgi:L-aspartate oxidase
MPSSITIVGGGLAGLFCALKLAPCPVTLITRAPLGDGASSSWAQGGIAAAIGMGDSPESHAHDTIVAGAGRVNGETAFSVAREASARIDDLLSFGVPFDRTLEGTLALSREAAHSQNRIVRVNGDVAGKAIMSALVAAVRNTPSITVLEHYRLEKLLKSNEKITGITAQSTRKNHSILLETNNIILTTGGIGQLYQITTNPFEACGDGLIAAHEAGAALADMEFVQFHPTAIDIGRDPAPLATEALRGEGAWLVNKTGERFMLRHHEHAELAPRDIVARGVFEEIAAERGAYLDTRHAVGSQFRERFPTVYATCLSAGIDPETTPIPVAPAAHYHMGGVETDAGGQTSVKGLWACGEVACTGLHGANRLASNSLLEAIVFGHRIAEALKTGNIVAASPPSQTTTQPLPDESSLITASRTIMNRHVGVIRDATGLQTAISELENLQQKAVSPFTRSRVEACLLITRAALARPSSIGAHYRADDVTTLKTRSTVMPAKAGIYDSSKIID